MNKFITSQISTLFFISVFIIALQQNVQAESSGKISPKYTPRVELTGKLGYSSKKEAKRNILRGGFVLPIFQQMNNYVSFITVIGLKDSAKHIEGNFGLGHRAFINKNWILGGYGFYDARKTENNNLIQQTTIGLEALSKYLEFRGNVYIPFGKSHDLGVRNIYQAKYNQQRNKTIFKKSQQNLAEIALYGFDLEAGGSLPIYPKLEGFLAFFYFNNKDVDSVTGVRIRTNYSFTHWCSIEAESNIDKKIGHTSYLGFKLSWDFNSSTNSNTFLSLNKKMTQLPIRDIDAITAVKEAAPFIVLEDARTGFVPFVLPKKAITPTTVIDSDVPYGIEDVEAINNAKLNGKLIADIAILDEEKIMYVGSNNNDKPSVEILKKYKISNINPKIMDKTLHPEFRKTVANIRVKAGKADLYKNTCDGLVTMGEAKSQGLNGVELSKAGIKQGVKKDKMISKHNIPEDTIKQAAESNDITLDEAHKSDALTPEQKAKKAIKQGIKKNEMTSKYKISENTIQQVAESNNITLDEAHKSDALTPEQKAKKAIKQGVKKSEMTSKYKISENTIQQVAESDDITIDEAHQSNALTPEQKAKKAIKQGIKKDEIQSKYKVNENDIKKAAQSDDVSFDKAMASQALTSKEAAQLGINKGISKQKLTDEFGIPATAIPKQKTKSQDNKDDSAKSKNKNDDKLNNGYNNNDKKTKVNSLIKKLSTSNDQAARKQSLKALASNNVAPSEFAHAKIKARELIDANYSVQQLIDSDITPAQMIEQDVLPSEIRNKGVDKAGLPLNSHTMLLKYDITPAKLRQGGVNTKQMLKDGLKPWVLREGADGLTTEQMIRDGADVMPTTKECGVLREQIWDREKKQHRSKLKQSRDKHWKDTGRAAFWNSHSDAKLKRKERRLLDSIKVYNNVTDHTTWSPNEFYDMHDKWFEASYKTENDNERASNKGTHAYGLKQKVAWDTYDSLHSAMRDTWRKAVPQTYYAVRFLDNKEYIAEFKKNINL